MCKVKIAKGAWRFQLLTPDIYRGHGLTKQYGHAACYLRNVTDPAKPSTQSASYWATSPENSWTKPPALTFPASDAGDAVVAAIAAGNLDQHRFEEQSLDQTLPTTELQDCFVGAVAAAVPGSDTLPNEERRVLELFCLHKRLVEQSASLLDALEKGEDSLPQPDNNGDPLKSKFTQYSPNSRAHCRDCQKLIQEGDVRVGAHVFSSSSRHAGYGINYWCLECMCAKASVKRTARLNAAEIDKILPGTKSHTASLHCFLRCTASFLHFLHAQLSLNPLLVAIICTGAELLSAPDVEIVCKLLGIPIPDPQAQAAMSNGRRRATRSGRKFGSWGGPSDGDGDGDGDGGEGPPRRRARR
jgi:hypothetical protein